MEKYLALFVRDEAKSPHEAYYSTMEINFVQFAKENGNLFHGYRIMVIKTKWNGEFPQIISLKSSFHFSTQRVTLAKVKISVKN